MPTYYITGSHSMLIHNAKVAIGLTRLRGLTEICILQLLRELIRVSNGLDSMARIRPWLSVQHVHITSTYVQLCLFAAISPLCNYFFRSGSNNTSSNSRQHA